MLWRSVAKRFISAEKRRSIDRVPPEPTRAARFRPDLCFTLAYLSILVLIPLAACFVKASSLGWDGFRQAAWTDRARAAYELTFGASLAAAGINILLGMLVAWVLVRYEFPLKRLVDSLVDLAVRAADGRGGLVYSSLYVENGWLGQFLVPLGFEGAYSRLAVVLVLTFIGLPFVVRTVQPVLESFDAGTGRSGRLAWAPAAGRRFCRVILPPLLPGDGHRLCPVVRPGLGRIRLGGVRLGQHAVSRPKSRRC